MKKMLLLGAVLFSAALLFADGTKLDVVKGTDTVVTLPGMTPDAENDVILTFSAFSVGPQGWSHSAVLTLNGKNIDWADAQKQQRLLDRSPWLIRGDRQERQPWFKKVGDQIALLLFIAKENKPRADARAINVKHLGLVYRINVSDLVKADGNELKINNVIDRKVVFSDVQLVKVSKAEVAEAIGLRQGPKTPYSAPVKTPAEFTPVGSPQMVNVPSKESATLEFPAVEVPEGKVLVLGYNGRILNTKKSGWGPHLTLSVNGTQLGAKTADGSFRLLGRGTALKRDRNGTVTNEPWFRNGGILTFVAPYYETELDPRIKEHREAGYDFYFNVSDCVQPGEKVTVTFTNTSSPLHMGLREVRLLLVDQEKLADLQK